MMRAVGEQPTQMLGAAELRISRRQNGRRRLQRRLTGSSAGGLVRNQSPSRRAHERKVCQWRRTCRRRLGEAEARRQHPNASAPCSTSECRGARKGLSVRTRRASTPCARLRLRERLRQTPADNQLKLCSAGNRTRDTSRGCWSCVLNWTRN